MTKPRPPKFNALSALCLVLLPFLLVIEAVGVLPYRLYRKAFDRPTLVNNMIGMTAIGLFCALHLINRLLLPRTRFEMFMIAPPLISSLVLPIIAAGLYLWWSEAVVVPICLMLILWMVYIPYKGAFRATISALQNRKLRKVASKSDDVYIPTRATITINVIGILLFCGTVGYFAGGLAGAMKALVVTGAILASVAGFIVGMVHAIWVYGPDAYVLDDEAVVIAA